MDNARTVGIVLAGGRSRRMGQNKALLNFKGRKLIDHMIDLLQASGLRDVFISGSLRGYSCIEDDKISAGPAQAIRTVLKTKPGYDGYLFVPVDMPLLRPEILHPLLKQPRGAYYRDRPLPAFIKPLPIHSRADSVQGLLNDFQIDPVDLPETFHTAMVNVNTRQDWEEVTLAS